MTINYSTTPTGTTKAIADYLQAAWGDIGVDVTQTPIEQSVLITNALLGSPDFDAFGWRNHAGLWVDTQYQWWHGFAADAKGGEAKDGGVALNFGRLNDPVINDLLDAGPQRAGRGAAHRARPGDQPAVRQGVLDPAARRGRRGASSWIPPVQNIGRDPLPDGEGSLADGAGFPGQVWLTSVVPRPTSSQGMRYVGSTTDPVHHRLRRRHLRRDGGDEDRQHDPARDLAGGAVSEAQIEQVKEDYPYLDKPLVVQYVYWLKDIFTGDWGRSYVASQSVVDMFKQRMPSTIFIGFWAIVIGLAHRRAGRRVQRLPARRVVRPDDQRRVVRR